MSIKEVQDDFEILELLFRQLEEMHDRTGYVSNNDFVGMDANLDNVKGVIGSLKKSIASLSSEQPVECSGPYPFNGTRIDRWEVKVGKWGAYLFDKENNIPVDLESVVERLNRLELRTQQLRWYVDTYGEVQS